MTGTINKNQNGHESLSLAGFDKLKVMLYDIEVFLTFWLVIFHDLVTGERTVFQNDWKQLRQFMDEQQPVLGGFNVKHYDQYILRCIYNGASNSVVKACNDHIIGGGQGWEFSWLKGKDRLPGSQFDLKDDIPVNLGLKEIMGHLGMDIVESSVSFDIDRELTEGEIAEVTQYCHHDLDATIRLYNCRRDYLHSKITVGFMKNIPWQESIGLTNAKLTAQYLDSKFVPRSDEFDYSPPTNLVVENYEVLGFFTTIDYKKKLAVDLAGTPHVVAWGGLHGAIKNYQETESENREIACYDVASYYPSLMIINGYMSRNVPDSEEFNQVYQKRLEAKKSGDKATANALKLVLNTTFGAMKNQYNELYDPKQANSVCISGQLYLIDLIEKLECAVLSLVLIQSNTDGIIISYAKSDRTLVQTCITDWESRTGFNMEQTMISRIVQKDVNNYCMSTQSGQSKVKGGYVANYDGGDWMNSNSPILDQAVVDSLLRGISPEKTINSCNDVLKFQTIAKTGGSYDKTVHIVKGFPDDTQKTNRVFATFDGTYGSIYKIKTDSNGLQIRRDKIANLPDHCWIDNSDNPTPKDLDRQWYTNVATKRIDDFCGAKSPSKKGRTKEMPDTVIKVGAKRSEISVFPTGICQKLAHIRKSLSLGSTIDAANKYDVEIANKFTDALTSMGLEYDLEAETFQFYPGQPNIAIVLFTLRIGDPDARKELKYKVFGVGEDAGTVAIHMAASNALRVFLEDRYPVGSQFDSQSKTVPIPCGNPVIKTIADPTRFITQSKPLIIEKSSPATPELLAKIRAGIKQLAAVGKYSDAETFKSFCEIDLTIEEAEAVLESIKEALQ